MYIIYVYYISTYVYYIIYNIIYLYLHISTLKELSQKLEHLISDAQVCYTSESPEGRLNQNTLPMSISIDSDSISLGGAQSSELRILKVPRGFSCAVRLWNTALCSLYCWKTLLFPPLLVLSYPVFVFSFLCFSYFLKLVFNLLLFLSLCSSWTVGSVKGPVLSGLCHLCSYHIFLQVELSCRFKDFALIMFKSVSRRLLV